MTRFKLTTAELDNSATFMHLLAKATLKENQRQERLQAAKRALAIANKLKNAAAKKFHQARIFSAMNKLRVV